MHVAIFSAINSPNSIVITMLQALVAKSNVPRAWAALARAGLDFARYLLELTGSNAFTQMFSP